MTSVLDVLEYTESTAIHLASSRRIGRHRGAHDLIIAAHAAETGRTVISLDSKVRFADLPGVFAVEP